MATSKRIPPARTLQQVVDIPARRAYVEDRFLDTLKRSAQGCWEWQGPLIAEGYGRVQFAVANKDIRAHRLSYTLFCGPIPVGLWVLHRCDNPRCVNPTHLFLGDRSANMADAASKGRIHLQRHPELTPIAQRQREKTHCPKGHPYDESNTLLRDGGRHRVCRACFNERQSRRRREKRRRERSHD